MSITQGELKVKTAILLIEIQNFCMEIKKNSHAYAHITGEVPDEAGDSTLFQPLEQAEITIYAGEDILFSGKLKTVHIEQAGKGYIASLDGVSNMGLGD